MQLGGRPAAHQRLDRLSGSLVPAEHGIDLSAAFLPPPNSKIFGDLMRPYVEIRDEALVEVKNRKKRETIAAKIGEKARTAFEALMREGTFPSAPPKPSLAAESGRMMRRRVCSLIQISPSRMRNKRCWA